MFITWSVRLIVASSTRSGAVIEPMGDTAHIVYDGKIKDTKTLKEKLNDIIPSDEQFRQAFEGAFGRLCESFHQDRTTLDAAAE